jgi:hypothetical protein
MKFRLPLFAALGAALLLGLAAVFFALRAPALIITDAPFASLYGAGRIRRQGFVSSLILFRRVKPVPIADGASADIVLFAIGEAASRPFCVIFPARFAEAARRYRQQSDEIPVLLMENSGFNSPNGDTMGQDSGGILIFKTDVETDLYRAGRCAALLAAGKPGEIVLFHNQSLPTGARNAFLKGLQDEGNEVSPRMLSHNSQLSEDSSVSCVVLAGSGADFFKRTTQPPVILFSWLNPAFIPREVVLAFDDSPWALAVPAVRMAVQQKLGGQIPSKTLIFSAKNVDNGVLRKLKKAARQVTP